MVRVVLVRDELGELEGDLGRRLVIREGYGVHRRFSDKDAGRRRVEGERSVLLGLDEEVLEQRDRDGEGGAYVGACRDRDRLTDRAEVAAAKR